MALTTETLSAVRSRILHTEPAREVIAHLPTESFRWFEHDYPSPIARWNYHPEFEIHLIRSSTGSYIIGDQIGPFGPGHVALIGSGLPHDWMSDLEPGQTLPNRDVVIHGDPAWLDRCITLMPELHHVRELFETASRGLMFTGATAEMAARELEAIGTTAGAARMAHFFAVLAALAGAPSSEKHLIAPEWFVTPHGTEARLAVEAGLAYIFENLAGQVRMSEAARLAHMSEPTFSKYFRRASGLTFSDMVKKLRIANACRLLTRTDDSIAAVALAVGYLNLANFNRQFLSEMGSTPSAFRRSVSTKASDAWRRGLTASEWVSTPGQGG